MSAPSWGVVATVDEPTALVVAFAAWHRAIGAREIHLYLDRPDPETEAALAALEGVFVTRCDAAYWAASPAGRAHKRPTNRQMVNANHAYARTDVDWLLHADADEFIRDGDLLVRTLAELPSNVPSLRLPTFERVHLPDEPGESIFEGGFRRRLGGFAEIAPEIYGRWAPYLAYGITGHLVGKSLTRTGLNVSIGIHFPQAPDKSPYGPEKTLRGQLLHFDGLTPLHYLTKLAHRIPMSHYQIGKHNPDGEPRRLQVDFVRRKATNRPALGRLVNGVQALRPRQVALLDALEVIHFAPFDPSPALEGLGLDLSPAGFDAVLRQRRAKLIEDTGLAWK